MSASEFKDVLSSILILFFIDQITFLVESIYMLNLLNTQVDIRALGILLLMMPIFLFFLRARRITYQILFWGMVICMIFSPLIPPAQRIFTSGIGAGLFLLYFGVYVSDRNTSRVNWGHSAALATLLSILFRVFGETLDVSLYGATVFIHWILVGIASLLFLKISQYYSNQNQQPERRVIPNSSGTSGIGVLSNTIGIFGSLIFIYFAFSSPAVLARWTEGHYCWIIIILSVSILMAVFFITPKIMLAEYLRSILLVWNMVFVVLFIANILVHRINFPTLENISPVVVEQSSDGNAVITYLMLIFSPVIFMNISWFSFRLVGAKSTKIAWSCTAGVIIMIVSIFMLIFTNTWGYVGAFSRLLRNQFHLPFVLAGITLVLPFIRQNHDSLKEAIPNQSMRSLKILAVVLAAGICSYFIFNKKPELRLSNINQKELILMTCNIQQGVDFFGNKNFDGQLKRIAEIGPDILCLQESDACRISGGNSDIVRYIARKLDYCSYYGPKTVTGTYGTAILSKYPLENCRTVFTYSSKDEIGTTFSEVPVEGRKIIIINSHPAGDNRSRKEHVKMVLSMIDGKENVIAMGDYNFRQDSPYYEMITEELPDSWLQVYPDAVGDIDVNLINLTFKDRKSSSGELLTGGKIDMTNRIDHIFLSESFQVKEAHYLPAPESETDHPLYWVVVGFQ